MSASDKRVSEQDKARIAAFIAALAAKHNVTMAQLYKTEV